MFPSRTSESHPFSRFPQYICTSTNNHALAATPGRNDAPNLFITTENMNYTDPLVSNCNVILPSRVVQPAVVKRKDKHSSKIVTARGPRDRRVRLSIDVSKKFFGLQDMLGFDKASETLDWLFKKSKSDIEELAQMKIQQKGMQVTTSFDVGQAEKYARELRRANARARARERTRRNQSLNLRSECTTSTKINLDAEMDRKICNCSEELCHMNNNVITPPQEASHGDILLPCTSTGNKWELSSIVASMSTEKVFQLYGVNCWEARGMS